MRVAPTIVLTDDERAQLQRLVRSPRTSVRLSQRARIVLLAAEGMQNKDIAQQLRVGRVQVARWRERYGQSRLAGIERDLARGAPPVKVDVARLVELTTQSKPEAATHWSTRKMASALGVSAATVSRHWRANGLKPHLVRGFKVSRDPKFVEKLEDIVGLYMAPPEHALVLCCDEKSQVQALDRTQPGLPLKKGRAGTLTHDYKRHGTTTLFAALNVLDGQVISQCQQRHRHSEWLKFLRQIDRETATDPLVAAAIAITIVLLAIRAALALYANWRLGQREHRRAAQFAALYDVGLATAGEISLDDLTRLAVDNVTRLTQTDGAMIALV